jgi:SAM-dependent methyltransferase
MENANQPPAMRSLLVKGRPRLILLSFLVLFIELALIRWAGSDIVYLSYFSNFILLGSFLGIGVGFLRARGSFDLFPWAVVALAFLVAFVRVFPAEVQRPPNQLLYFGGLGTSGLPVWVTLPVIFIAVATAMAMLGQGVAKTFVTLEPLEAYRLDILGSVGGIGAFALLSFLRAPPLGWALIASALFVLLYAPSIRLIQVVAIIGLLLMLGQESFRPDESWSPYYRVSLIRHPGAIEVKVNGIPHQSIESLALRAATEPIYLVPYARARVPMLNDVLVIGAGNGADVAAALAEGARHVDAVEIDPRLFELGRDLNPDHPYQDPRVDVLINDGRAYLEQTHRHYDLILFALPDSITLVAGQSSLRLESYLFTIEAIRTARDHLRPGGAFAMYNYYRAGWLVDRLAGTLQQAFGRAPCVDEVGTLGHLAALTDALDGRTLACARVWRPREPDTPAPATDNHPFVYLQHAAIPAFYLLTILLIFLASILAVRVAGGPLGQIRGFMDLFFMGAAFLLLETKNVVQFALLFGTTWLVNALVFGGILATVLVAVEVARHVRFRRPEWLYVGLLISLAIGWLVPAHELLRFSFVPRFALATIVAFAPIFLANLVFAERFRGVEETGMAFGANLLGAMVGGLLEYTSLIIGYRMLLFVVAGLYGLAFLSRRRSLLSPESDAPLGDLVSTPS